MSLPKLAKLRFAIGLLAILALGAGLRLFRLRADPPLNLSWSHGIFTDGPATIAGARAKFLTGDWSFGSARFPLLSVVTYASFKCLGLGLAPARLPFVLAGLLTILIVGLLVREEAGTRAGLLAALLVAVNYNLVMYSRLTLSESYLSLFMILSLYFWQKGLRSRRFLALSGLSLLIGIAFVKPHGVYLLPALLLGLLFLRGNERHWRAVGAAALIFLSSFIAGLLAWLWFVFLPDWRLITGYLVDNLLTLPGSPLAGLTLDNLVMRYLTCAVESQLATRSPVVCLLAYGYLLYLLAQARSRWRPVSPLVVSTALWLLLGFGLLAFFNYRPLRYQLPLLLPACILAALALEGIFRARSLHVARDLGGGVLALAFFWLLFLCYNLLYNCLQMTRVVTSSRRLTNEPFLSTVEHHLLLSWAILLTMLLTIAVQVGYHSKALAQVERIGRRMCRKLGVLLVAISVGLGCFHYSTWAAKPRYDCYRVSRDLGQILSEGATVAGPYAAGTGLENTLGAMCMLPPSARRIERYFERYPQVTHLLFLEFGSMDLALKQNYGEFLDACALVARYDFGTGVQRLVRLPRSPSYQPSRFEQARASQAQGQYELAVQHYQAFLVRRPRHPAALAGLGECHLHLGQAAAAEKALLDARESNPAGHLLYDQLLDRQITHRLCRAYRQRGKTGQAREELQRLKEGE